ncbi:MAG: diguanylate cyclase [bacterium]|nr:diguanylate cyclase [bacterium]
MTSVFAELRKEKLLNELRLIRVGSDDLRWIERHLAQLGVFDRPLALPGHSAARCYWLASDAAALIIEPEPVSPALFAIDGDRYSIGFSTSVAVREWLERLVGLNLSVDKTDSNALLELLDPSLRLWEQQCRCRAFEAVISEPRLDREGADFFDALEGRLRTLFAPDYLEIAPIAPSSFWADRPDGWSWIYAARPDFQWPVPLAGEFETTLLRTGTPHFLLSLDDRALLLPPPNGSVGLRCGLILPLLFRGRRLGIVKLLFARDVIMSGAEETALPVVQQGLSLILDRTSEHLRTQRMAMVDGLTNLFNHRFFLTQLRTEFQRSLRYGGVMTLLMIDVDGFKNYNDTYGHQAGNRVLAWVANQIRRTVRDIDVVARYGGEEFALILPGSPRRTRTHRRRKDPQGNFER